LVAIGTCFGPDFDPVTIQRIVVDHALVVIPKDELRKLRYLHVGQKMQTVNVNSHRSTQSQWTRICFAFRQSEWWDLTVSNLSLRSRNQKYIDRYPQSAYTRTHARGNQCGRRSLSRRLFAADGAPVNVSISSRKKLR